MANLSWLILVAVVALALVGIAGIFIGAASRQPRLRHRAVTIGGGAFASAGLMFMLAGLMGVRELDETWCGLLMLVFGTGVSVAPSRENIGKSEGPAP
jgi:hypothetical protein